MSIQKIPRCPFCRHQMKQNHDVTADGTGTIIVQMQKTPTDIMETVKLEMFFCENCGFVAFWHGDPQ